jgi:hypothetical protein
MHLLAATDKLASSEPQLYEPEKDRDAQAKALGLTVAQFDRIGTLRQTSDGDTAFEQGQDLPADLRAYTAGAVDFGKNELDRAASRFQQVLTLPADQAMLRSVWAAYMLGRIHAAKASEAASDVATFQRERAAAAKAFQQARTLAVGGASDPQGLAVASFGEEARLYLYSRGKQCSWSDLLGSAGFDGDNEKLDKTCADGIATENLKRAITLYAAQAGHDSTSGVQSLVAIADNAMRSEQRVAELIDSPVPQRLLVAYALARMSGSSEETSSDSAANKPDPRLQALVHAIEQRGLDQVAGADRLAALAYQLGHYELAGKLADKAPGPMADWVHAKLALQKGDMAAASAAYAAAAKAFPRVDDAQPAIEPANVHLLTGERGVLALARGEYVEAMGHLYDAASGVGGDGNVYDEDLEMAGMGYGNDAAYVAERVLTVDELKAFVDAHAAATPIPAKGKDENSYYRNLRPLGDNLRWLLARRLMRAGRYDEAQAYFPVDGDPRFGTFDEEGKLQVSSLRSQARDYAQALHDSEHAWTDIGKAQALYAAAVIARESGMEILGYEQGPDYNDNGGSYQGGSGQEADSLKQPYVTDGERQRYAESVAKPNYRFHYRYLAADHAVRAADLLPARSQAFAAVMCQAVGWMLEGPPDYNDHHQGYGEPVPSEPPERLRRATAYYQRYVKQGPYVAWADNFGRNCEEPDFARARQLKRTQQVVAVRHAMRRYFPIELAGFIVLISGLAAWIVLRRRRPKAD